MPQCINCNNEFPYRIKIDGKQRILNNRKYCLDCSPFGQHNTRKINKNLSDVKTGTCNHCGKDYIRGRGSYVTHCKSCAASVSRQKSKVRAVEYKGGSCQICGYSRCVSALEFHHKDPALKSFQISGSTKKWEILKVELDKCVMVCSNCHRELESGLISL